MDLPTACTVTEAELRERRRTILDRIRAATLDTTSLPLGYAYRFEYQEEGKTVVGVGKEKNLLGIIALRDQIRPGAFEVIRALHTLGVKVAMLTGDHERTAAAIARELRIDHYHAELKPEDKARYIRRMEREVGPVAMVGDGINDAPALAAATVGIAMGVAGSDVAIETADVALMADDLHKIAYALRLGRLVRSVSVQNIVFSLLVLSVLIPGALIGAITVVVAVAVHETSELLAVANGLRVSRYAAPNPAKGA